MKSNIFLRVIILLCLLPSFVCAATDIAPQEAKVWVQNQGNALLDAFGEPDLNRKYASLDKMLAESIDLNYVAKYAVHKARALKNAIWSVTAVLDIVDITDEVLFSSGVSPKP